MRITSITPSITQAIGTLILPWLVSAASAQTAPSTKLSLPEGPLKMHVVEVVGDVGLIKPGSDDILDAKVGADIPEGTEVVVGQRSAIQLDVGTGQFITFRRMTSAVITRAAIESGSINVDVGMKYGQTQFEGESQDRAIRTSVRTPSATLGIRGTKVAISDQPPFAPQMTVLSGRVDYSDLRKHIAVGQKHGGKVHATQSSDTAAEAALSSTYVDPSISNARSPTEQQFLNQVYASGASVTFQSGFPIVRGGTPPSFDALQKTVPLGLVYIFRWTGNIDFNLTETIQETGQTIYPAPGSNRTSSGFTAFDNQGGPHGGYEEIVYPPGYPGSNCISVTDANGNTHNEGTVTLFRRADFVPNGNSSDYELRAYIDKTLSLDVTGSVDATGAIQEQTVMPFTAHCTPATMGQSTASATAASTGKASKSTPGVLAPDPPDCGCSALKTAPSVPSSSKATSTAKALSITTKSKHH